MDFSLISRKGEFSIQKKCGGQAKVFKSHITKHNGLQYCDSFVGPSLGILYFQVAERGAEKQHWDKCV